MNNERTHSITGENREKVFESIERILNYVMSDREWDDLMENPDSHHVAMSAIEVGMALFGWDNPSMIFTRLAKDEQTHDDLMQCWEEYSSREFEPVLEGRKIQNDGADDLRQRLAESELEQCSDGTVLDILLEGCAGYKSMSAEDIEEQYFNIYGDLELNEVLESDLSLKDFDLGMKIKVIGQPVTGEVARLDYSSNKVIIEDDEVEGVLEFHPEQLFIIG